MSELDMILKHNQEFVEKGNYIEFVTNKFPEKKLAILSCMDTRMTKFLPDALGLENGDAKLIKNAGALVSHPWGSVMRSLLVAVFELKVEEIMVIAHYDCGMNGLNSKSFLEKVYQYGVATEKVDVLRDAGINLDNWLTGFTNATH